MYWPEKGEHFKKVSYKIPFLFRIFSKRTELELLTELFSQKLGMENKEKESECKQPVIEQFLVEKTMHLLVDRLPRKSQKRFF